MDPKVTKKQDKLKRPHAPRSGYWYQKNSTNSKDLTTLGVDTDTKAHLLSTKAIRLEIQRTKTTT